MGMRLEIAAGDRPTTDYIHHDARPLPHIEIVCDMWDLPEKVAEGSCSAIRATHILEHFSHRDTIDVLRLWRRLLAAGGGIYIEVPNLTWQARRLAEVGGDTFAAQAEVVRLMYGDQDYPGNYHMTGFTEELLSHYLAQAGFKVMRIQDIGAVLIVEGVAV